MSKGASRLVVPVVVKLEVLAHDLTDGLDYAVLVNAEHGHDILVQTDGGELVGDAELLEGAALAGLNDDLGDCAAETADDVVILNGGYP